MHSRKTGFTLAEILITLGIIGVVAAITIPGLITNYRKHIVETRVASFYSKINQAIKLSEQTENGEAETWAARPAVSDVAGQQQWIRQYISPFLKCYEDTTTVNNKLLITLPDSSQFQISQIDWKYYPLGYNTKRTNRTGRDYFYFEFNPGNTADSMSQLSGNAVMPYMYNYTKFTHEDMIKNCKGEFLYGVGPGAYCTVLLQQNGWKIPNDYPHKF